MVILDIPNDRSLHHVPTPKTGGIAIVVSSIVGVVLAMAVNHLLDIQTLPFPEMGWILPASLSLAVISLIADAYNIRKRVRFSAHFIAALVVVCGAHLSIQDILAPYGKVFHLGYAAIPVTILSLMWMTNLFNFMDGMDGFAGGMAIIGLGTLGFISMLNGHPEMLFLAGLVAAGVAGFLVFNFPPAKIFMGDSGSVSIGFFIGGYALTGFERDAFDFWAALIVFSPFVLDATVTITRRFVSGQRVSQPHREHYYQRIALLGWGHQKTMQAEYALMFFCGVAAVCYTFTRPALQVTILMIWSLTYLAITRSVYAAEVRLSHRGRRSVWT